MVIRRIVFADDNLIERNYAVGFAEFNINTVLFDALNDCRQNFVFFVGIFLKDCALFRFANALHNDLLCSLRRDSAEILCVRFFLENIADFIKRIYLLCFFN